MSNQKEFTYKLPKLGWNRFPHIEKEPDVKAYVRIDADGNIDIVGNSKGLLFMAKYIVAMGLIEDAVEDLHVHLDPGWKLDKDSFVVTIVNLDLLSDDARKHF